MSHPQVELIIRRTGQPERRMILSSGVTSLGRAEDNQIVLPDIGVSRRHARILNTDQGVSIEDLGSGNGTFVGGDRVKRYDLHDGDEVTIEPFTLGFRLHASDAAASAPHDSVLDERTAHVAAMGEGPGARLVTLSGQRLASAYPLAEQPLRIGRAEGRDVVMYDPAASRNHAVVERRGSTWWYLDQGSANGSYVNGRRVREQSLSNGDRIRIGTTEFLFEWIQQPESPPPEPQPVPVVAVQSVRPEAVPMAHVDAERPTVSRPARSSFGPLQAIAVFVVAVIFVLGLATLGGAGWLLYSSRSPAPVAAPVGVPVQATVSPANADKVQSLMDDGALFMHQQRYLDAAARFYKVLKLEPAYTPAQRQGYLACEEIAFQKLDQDLARRLTSEAEQRKQYRQALALADKALAEHKGLGAARSALSQALTYFPGDPDLSDRLAKVKAAETRAGHTSAARQRKSDVKGLYLAARAHFDAGRMVDAIQGYEKVRAADPEHTTHYCYDAEDDITEAKARLEQQAAPAWKAAKVAMQSKDWRTARDELEKVLQIDPYHQGAREALSKVEQKLSGD